MVEEKKTWSSQTLDLVKVARSANLPEADARKAISAFLTIDLAIKTAQQVEHLLEEYRDGKLTVTDFLDAIMAIVSTDRTMVGAQVDALHSHLGVAKLVKATKPKKAKDTAKPTEQASAQVVRKS